MAMIGYLSGPMRGYPHFNMATFHAAKKILEERGWTILSPADLDAEEGHNFTGRTGFDLEAVVGFDLTWAFRRDVEAILKSNAIILLPGWENSEGVAVEKLVSEKIGLVVLTYEQALNYLDSAEILHNA